MQVLVQAVCSVGPSVRDAVAKDARIGKYHLEVIQQKRPGRPHGWTKIRSTKPDRFGAINVEWDADTSVLICRVVTRGHRPNLIIGDFVDYLLGRHGRRIQALNIIPRR